ncbi:IS21 family transposase [Alkaliphilus hydrothermalis]|nr:IS21 family transposase [Alkaliphilus hydrothermalis]
MHDWEAVMRLHRAGVPKKAIARSLNMSKNTVKSLIKKKKPPKYEREYYPTKIDSYKDQIREWYLNPQYDFIGTRIFRELKQRGYEGSINPIYRYLLTLKEEKDEITKRATIRVETPYGDQSQFDWSPYKVDIGGKLTEVHCLTMILSASRKKAVVFSKSVDGDSIYEAIEELFRDLGGVTKELIIDNPKALVISHEKDKEVKYNESTLMLSMHLGTELNACRPYRARTKGKVEKPYQYIEEQFIKGSSFKSMIELNFAAKEFINTWNKEINGTTKRSPDDMFLEEIEYLLPLPNKRFMNTNMCKRKVSLDSMVSVDSNKYSVPVKYVDKSVRIRKVYGFRLEIYTEALEKIAEHEIITGKGKNTVVDSHYWEIQNLVPKSIPEIKRQFVATFELGEEYFKRTASILKQPSFHARGFLKLRELYDVADLNKILNYCLESEIYRIESIKEVIKEKYLEIILNHNQLDPQENESLSDIAKTTEFEGLIRDISYYEGGQN